MDWSLIMKNETASKSKHTMTMTHERNDVRRRPWRSIVRSEQPTPRSCTPVARTVIQTAALRPKPAKSSRMMVESASGGRVCRPK